MSNVSEYHQKNLIETLERVESRAKSLQHAVKFEPKDLSKNDEKKIHQALSLLDEVISSTLQAQKARGKEFLSDDDIDELFKRINLTYGK